MPDGLTHSVDTFVVSTLLAFSLPLAVHTTPLETLCIVGGSLSGLILSPDLDVDRGFFGFYFSNRLLGNLPSNVWRLIWKPYAKLISHRSWLSHSIVISTTIRILYLTLVPLLIYFYFNRTIPDPGIYFWLWFSGLCLSDAIHVVHDYVHTKLVRRRHR